MRNVARFLLPPDQARHGGNDIVLKQSGRGQFGNQIPMQFLEGRPTFAPGRMAVAVRAVWPVNQTMFVTYLDFLVSRLVPAAGQGLGLDLWSENGSLPVHSGHMNSCLAECFTRRSSLEGYREGWGASSKH